jgi:hypothetical protein
MSLTHKRTSMHTFEIVYTCGHGCLCYRAHSFSLDSRKTDSYIYTGIPCTFCSDMAVSNTPITSTHVIPAFRGGSAAGFKSLQCSGAANGTGSTTKEMPRDVSEDQQLSVGDLEPSQIAVSPPNAYRSDVIPSCLNARRGDAGNIADIQADRCPFMSTVNTPVMADYNLQPSSCSQEQIEHPQGHPNVGGLYTLSPHDFAQTAVYFTFDEELVKVNLPPTPPTVANRAVSDDRLMAAMLALEEQLEKIRLPPISSIEAESILASGCLDDINSPRIRLWRRLSWKDDELLSERDLCTAQISTAPAVKSALDDMECSKCGRLY